MLDGLGIETGVTLPALVEASRYIESRLDHPLPSRYYRATQARVKRSPMNAEGVE
jgi:hydroxymethylglutaryl-CoA lyase